jgi:hypothetical protein
MWDCNCGRKYNFDGKPCKKCGANPPSSQQKEASPPIKQQKELPKQKTRKQRSKKILVKRGSTYVKTKDKQKKKPEKQVQKQPQQLPPNGSSSKPSMAKDEPKVTQSQKEEATDEKQNTHNLWSFSNVVLFTGSASYVDETDKNLFKGIVAKRQYMTKNYVLSEWDHQNFMTVIMDKIPKTLQSKIYNFKFILNTKKNPFKEGTRQFNFYKSMEKYPGEHVNCGEFDCASSYWDSNPKTYSLSHDIEVGNTSSNMLREDLRNWVDGIVKSNKVGFPVFSVCDCNTFHTTGYVWGYYALKKASNFLDPLKLAVINFDQHEDTGGSGVDIGSDHWGNGVLKELEDLGHGGLYAVVGQGNKGNVYIFKSKESKLDLGSLSQGNVNWDHFWNNGGKDINAVFVTVDRDCLKDHYTQWQDNSYFNDWEDLQRVMSDVLKPLFNEKRETKAYLIGVDITGLPEHYEIWQGRYQDRKKPNSSSLWADVDSQIDGIRAEVADQLEVTASLPKKQQIKGET